MEGDGDARRTLELLWRARQTDQADRADRPRRRGRKPTRTVDEIIEAATALADAEGLEAVSMSTLARRLGVATMSLYTYVPGKAELVEAMVDAALAERDLGRPDQSGDWRRHIEHYAVQTRALYRRHPWLCQVSMARPPLGPGLLAQQEYLCAVLAGIGLSARRVAMAVEAIVLFTNAVAGREAEAQQAERATGQTRADWAASRRSFWDDYFDPEHYPAMTALWHAGAFGAKGSADALADAYEFGLRRLLDGIAAMIEVGSER